jgi:hypothetical protein
MQFPDIEAADLTPDEHRTWLTMLLTAMGDHADQLVPRLSPVEVESVLFFLVNMLNEAQAENTFDGVTWQRFLRLD